MIRSFVSSQFVYFLLTGATAAIVNFTSRILYNQWFDFSLSILLAFLTGLTTAFVLARLFVFKNSRKKLHHSAVAFTLVNLAALAQTWAISMGLAYYVLPALGVSRLVPEIAHAAGIVFPVFTSYLGHKHWSFR